jgi:minor capsid protein 2
MTTPLPQTPGDQREDHAQAAADAIAALYAAAELAIIAAIADLTRRVASGAMLPRISSRRLAAIVDGILSRVAPRARRIIDATMAGAANQSRRLVTPSPAPATIGPGVANQYAARLAALLDQAGDNTAASADEVLSAAVTAARAARPEPPAAPRKTPPSASPRPPAPPPPPDNPYHAAIGRAFGEQGGWPGQSLSYRRIQAAQAVLDDLGRQGITGFTDRTGRNWDLATYVEMATRTTVSSAWDDMQEQAAIRSGLDLVKTGTTSTEGSCPLCLPWLGKTLSLVGTTEGYPTVADAKAAGWRHPNCRCFWTVIGGGYMEDVTNPVPVEQAAAAYRASQWQRAHERNVRAAVRAIAAAATPAARARARRWHDTARTASDAHRRRNNVVMMKVSVERRERPFGAR